MEVLPGLGAPARLFAVGRNCYGISCDCRPVRPCSRLRFGHATVPSLTASLTASETPLTLNHCFLMLSPTNTPLMYQDECRARIDRHGRYGPGAETSPARVRTFKRVSFVLTLIGWYLPSACAGSNVRRYCD